MWPTNMYSSYTQPKYNLYPQSGGYNSYSQPMYNTMPEFYSPMAPYNDYSSPSFPPMPGTIYNININYFSPNGSIGTQMPGYGFGSQMPISGGFGMQMPGNGFGSQMQMPGSGFGSQMPIGGGFGMQMPGLGFGSQMPGFGSNPFNTGFGIGNQPSSQDFMGMIMNLLLTLISKIYDNTLDIDSIDKKDKTDKTDKTDDTKDDENKSEADKAKEHFNSDEYKNKNRSDKAKVKDLYEYILGRKGDDKGVTYWSDKLKSGEMTLDEIIDAFYNSREYKNKNSAKK